MHCKEADKLTDAVLANNGPLLMATRGLISQLRLLAVLERSVYDARDACCLRYIA